MEFYKIVVGVILLVFGRKLFWLFVGLAGFLFGLEITRMLFVGQPSWLQLTIAIGLGCFGALLAVLAQRLAFTAGGFFAGVFLAVKVSQYFAVSEHGFILWLIFGAGVCGALIATLIMDEAITILTCLLGAGAIVGELPGAPILNFLEFLILTGVGLLLQEKLWPTAKDARHP